MKHFLSFLSGFGLPVLLLVLSIFIDSGGWGLTFIVLAPFLLLINFVTLFVLKFFLKEKYILWLGLLGIFLPVVLLLLMSLGDSSNARRV